MRRFLDDYINTLGFESRKRAAFILEEAKLEKDKVDLLAKKLESSGRFANLVIPEEQESSQIKAGRIVSDFMTIAAEMENMYDVSNLISLLISTHTSVLSSDIKLLDDELSALEKAIKNYSFLLADGGSYDFAFLEPFNDERNREFLDFAVPDRSGIPFNALEHASVNSDEGVLSIPKESKNSWPLTATILAINASEHATSDTDISNTTNKQSGKGWRYAVASPSVITSGVSSPEFYDYESGGLQAIIEYVLETPSPVDTITIEPLSDAPLDIFQIRVYKDNEETEYFDIINRNVETLEQDPNTSVAAVHNLNITKPKSFHFPLQAVAKFKILIRSATYRRSGLEPIRQEEQYRQVKNAIVFDHPYARHYDASSSAAQREVLLSHKRQDAESTKPNNRFSSPYRANMPRYQENNWGALAKSFSALEHQTPQSSTSIWSNSDIGTTTVTQMLREVMNNEDLESLYISTRRTFKNDKFLGHGGKPGFRNDKFLLPGARPERSDGASGPGFPSDPPTDNYSPDHRSYHYEYVLGLKSVRASSNAKNFRAVFVSKQLPSPGDCGEVKLKTEHSNYLITDTSRDSSSVTSIEYSITNVANPRNEDDWLPILPVETTQVIGERFFPDETGKGYFRFPASLLAETTIYKNGHIFDPVPLSEMIMRSPNRQNIIGLKLPTATYSIDDIFTVDYIPAFDNSIINFEDQLGIKFSNPPLVSSFDEDGAGEGFTGTNGQLSIRLGHKPYVDYTELEDSTYVDNFGLSGSYNPVVVRFDDGTVAYNLTNYIGGEQTPLNADANEIQFIHTNDEILFNRTLGQPFRVYYQYLPSNIRVRVVLRVNYSDFVSPKVDFYQLKAKTRKADARKDS